MNTHTPVAPSALTISDISVRQDDKGRYCLNDLHKAAGDELKHRPNYWLASQQAKDLIAEMEKAGIPAFYKTRGRNGATYVTKELVYAYAMWISASFSLKVIRAYDALQTAIPTAVETREGQAKPIEPFRTRILVCVDRDQTTQQIVPFGSCIVDPNDPDSLKTIISECVPIELLPQILEWVSQRMARHFKYLDMQQKISQSSIGHV